MRAFIVICLAAVACADKLGYNYQPVGHSGSGLSFAPGTAFSNLPSNSGDNSAGPNTAPSYSGPQGGSAPTYDDQSYAPQAELEKEFFTFTANDEDFNDGKDSNKYAEDLKQGLRVIFIKGPENNGLEKAAVALAKHVSEQKTDIYVLNKQADLASLSNKLNTLNKNNNNKPEVHFVKYRTPEDAANAQRAIQGQYESLGGPSESYNGGVAPVLNFASSAPVAPHGSHGSPDSHGSHDSHGPHASHAPAFAPESSYIPPASSYIPPSSNFAAPAPSSTYLPASIYRLFRL